LTLVRALGGGLVAGVLFAFSAFVMKGLSRIPAPQGIAAMQSINVAAVSPLFMVALFGTAVSCTALLVVSLAHLRYPGAAYQIVGSVCYLAAIALTIFYHVPLNDSLATLDPTSVEATRSWTTYVDSWTTWNHVRTIEAFAAAVILTVVSGKTAR